MIYTVLLVFSFVLSVIAAWQSPAQPSPFSRLIALALAFYFAACIFGSAPIAHVFGVH